MDSTRFQLAQSVFQAVCDLPPDQRDSELRRLCGADAELLAEVAGLIAQDEDSGVLEVTLGLGGVIAAASLEVAPTPAVPQVIGRFRLLERVGLGGMGEVYKAEQDSPRRNVALKVLRPGLASIESVRRFRRESQVLGSLRHRCIAHIIEAGSFEQDGLERPYLAMEFVSGKPFVEACRPRELRDRLRLFVELCRAIEYAHQKGVIHRDIKPSNVLVVEEQGESTVKVLDFGVARVFGEFEHDVSFHTSHGQLIGTLAYVAPEQIVEAPSSVDTRADVYSLGVVLFESLTGELPIALGNLSLPEAARAVAEVPPRRLAIADASLAGDLDVIIRHALEKQPAQRYQSVAELRSDIERVLRGEPIAARPLGRREQLHRWVRAHRGLAAGLALAGASLIAGTTVSAIMAVRARQAERTAAQSLQRVEQERQKLEAVNRMFSELLSSPNPAVAAKAGLKSTTDVRVVDVLDAFAKSLPERLSDQPGARAAMHSAIAKAYAALEVIPAAREQATIAGDMARDVEGPGSLTAIDASQTLVHLHELAAEFDAAVRLQKQTLQEARGALGEDHPTVLKLETGLVTALFYSGDLRGAGEAAALALEHSQSVLGASHPMSLAISHNIGYIQLHLGQNAEAERTLASVYAARLASLGESSPDTLTTASALANALRQNRKPTEAVPLLESVLRNHCDMYGSTHRIPLQDKHNLAVVLSTLSDDDKRRAAQYFEEVIRDSIATLGADHHELPETRVIYAKLLGDLGRWDEAVVQARAATIATPGDAAAPRARIRTLVGCSEVLSRAGLGPEALDSARTAAEQAVAALPAGDPLVIRCLRNLGACCERHGSLEEAIVSLDRAKLMCEQLSPPDTARIEAITRDLERLRALQAR